MNDLIFKAANVIHRTVLSLSGGRLGGDVLNMPVLELTTTGAKSGQKRTAMLTTPVQEGDTIVIVASRGGDPEHPGWFPGLASARVAADQALLSRRHTSVLSDFEAGRAVWVGDGLRLGLSGLNQGGSHFTKGQIP